MNKPELRSYYLAMRRNISSSRKKEAAGQLALALQPYCMQFERIASFCSTRDEIDTQEINRIFAAARRLLLPRRHKETLGYHFVTDLSALESTPNGLLEPIPTLSPAVTLTSRDLILVPALAFDQERFRLGYGKGHFDRFLAGHPTITTVGIGFREQLSSSLFPRDAWDLPVHALMLF